MQFTKLTEAEIADFMEAEHRMCLTRSFTPRTTFRL